MATTSSGASALLVYPPSRIQEHSSCPLGIQMVAAVLEKHGHRVRLIDANAVARPRSVEEIVRVAKEASPDVIGMTLLTPLIRDAYRLAQLLGGNGAKLVAGGPHASLLPEEAILHGFDGAVVGEGEATVAEAVEALLGRRPSESVLGWVFRDAAGQPRRTDPRPQISNLDDLPLPARHLVDPLDYGPPGSSSLHGSLFSSRGCPANCAFCSGSMFGRRFRFRSAENILREIVEVHRAHGTRHFHFVDDAMTVDRERVVKLCQGILEERLPITWSMMTRIDSTDEELLQVVGKAGCVQVDYGVESGCPDTLRRIHKPHTVDMVRRLVPATAKCGMKPYVFFILGFPWEGPEELDMTLGLMKELAPFVDRFHPAIASILIPFPKTEIYEKYKAAYGFEEWWLTSHRSFDAPNPHTHPLFEQELFPLGAVLDANFFHYSREVRTKIVAIFKFMHAHNHRNKGMVIRCLRKALVELSEHTFRISPRLESVLFGRLRSAGRAVKRALRGKNGKPKGERSRATSAGE